MQQRKRITGLTLIILGIATGYFLKNMKIGLILGLLFGVLSGRLLVSKKSDK